MAAAGAGGRPTQTWNPDSYQRNASFVADLGQPVVELLAPRPGERILDLGCGDGRLSERIAATGAVVHAVDASAPMVAAALARGLDAQQMNGEALAFEGAFDAVFTNAALHWMRDAAAVVAGVRRSLRPGGRFVGEFGGFGNVAAIRVAAGAVLRRRRPDMALVDPWYFPTAEEYASLLAAHGFRVEAADLIPRPTQLPTGIIGWLETFAIPLFSGLPPEVAAGLREEVAELLEPVLRTRSGQWFADYVRLRFSARLDA